MATVQFDWDEENTDHLARHGISQADAEQVLLNWQIDLDSYVRNGEERVVQAGETDRGWILVVVSTIRGDKTRVITAWPAKERIRRYFATQKRSRDAGRTEADGIRE
jgi:uncharacterized DUF497 family protein